MGGSRNCNTEKRIRAKRALDVQAAEAKRRQQHADKRLKAQSVKAAKRSSGALKTSAAVSIPTTKVKASETDVSESNVSSVGDNESIASFNVSAPTPSPTSPPNGCTSTTPVMCSPQAQAHGPTSASTSASASESTTLLFDSNNASATAQATAVATLIAPTFDQPPVTSDCAPPKWMLPFAEQGCKDFIQHLKWCYPEYQCTPAVCQTPTPAAVPPPVTADAPINDNSFVSRPRIVTLFDCQQQNWALNLLNTHAQACSVDLDLLVSYGRTHGYVYSYEYLNAIYQHNWTQLHYLPAWDTTWHVTPLDIHTGWWYMVVPSMYNGRAFPVHESAMPFQVVANLWR